MNNLTVPRVLDSREGGSAYPRWNMMSGYTLFTCALQGNQEEA